MLIGSEVGVSKSVKGYSIYGLKAQFQLTLILPTRKLTTTIIKNEEKVNQGEGKGALPLVAFSWPITPVSTRGNEVKKRKKNEIT